MKKVYRTGAFAIIVDNHSNFLLVQKNNYKKNEWTFVGGGREEGETVKQNIYREINEELSLNEKDLQLLGISEAKIKYDYPTELIPTIHQGKYVGQIQDQCLFRFTGDKGKIHILEEELKDKIWVHRNKLEEYLIFPNQFEKHSTAIEEILRLNSSNQ